MLSLDQIKQFYSPSEKIAERNMLREYLQYKILEIIFDVSVAAKLNFIGGTALRIIYSSDRFSEDLDFDHFGLSKKEFQLMAQIVKKRLLQEGFNIELRCVFREAYRCYLKFPGLLFNYGLSSHPQEKIVIQIDTTQQTLDLPPELKIINKFGVFAQIRINPAAIILSQKVTAILKRKRVLGRDLYDVVFLASLVSPNFFYLQEKIGIKNGPELKRVLQQRVSKFDLDQLAKDLFPFVSDSHKLQVVQKFDLWLRQWRV